MAADAGTALLGRDYGAAPALVCYGPAAGPASVLVESTSAPGAGRRYDLVIGLAVPGGPPLVLAGGCTATPAGGLACGADWQGARLGVAPQGGTAVLLSLPPGLASVAGQARLDLARVDVKQCRSLLSDAARAAVYGPLEAPR